MFQATDLNIWLEELIFEHGRIRLNKPVSGALNRVSILHTWNTASPRKEVPGEVCMLIYICKAEKKPKEKNNPQEENLTLMNTLVFIQLHSFYFHSFPPISTFYFIFLAF